MSKRVSVVIATYNRGALLQTLLHDLARQTLPDSEFEVIVVDDGSVEPVGPILEELYVPYDLFVEAQANAGPAAARHRGIEKARGEIIVIIDDDMRVEPIFLAEHLRLHEGGATVVLGHIAPAPDLDRLPVFERFHAHQLACFIAAAERGAPVRGIHVCTGNLSLRRADYLALGGFDPALRRSEDRELGVRLEKGGAKLVFGFNARSSHGSDHTSMEVWLRRAFDYGVYDRRIGCKHPDIESADPWSFYFMVSPISRPLLLAAVVAPAAGERLARSAMAAALAADAHDLRKLAVMGTTLCYGLQYFRGMRVESGSTHSALRDLLTYFGKRHRQAMARGLVIKHRECSEARDGSRVSLSDIGKARATTGGARQVDAKTLIPTEEGATLGEAFRRFARAVRADFGSLQRYRKKYHGEVVSLRRLPIELVRKIGFQTAVAVRVMQLSRDLGLPLAPQLISRFIRHVYCAEIHWNAQIAPGISIVHGVGLVISHGAQVSEGCILFHNVTLGQGLDPKTRVPGAPRLGRNVHVGPGTTLLGPIDVGTGSKIMAGSVLTRSVPPRSLVKPAASDITLRDEAQ